MKEITDAVLSPLALQDLISNSSSNPYTSLSSNPYASLSSNSFASFQISSLNSPPSFYQSPSSSSLLSTMSNQSFTRITNSTPKLSILLKLSYKALQLSLHFSSKYEDEMCDSLLKPIISIFQFHRQFNESSSSSSSSSNIKQSDSLNMKQFDSKSNNSNNAIEIDFLRVECAAISFIHSLSRKIIFSQF